MNSREWPGTDEEKLALRRAVRRNCGCTIENGRTSTQAGCHQLLIPDERVWNHLIFVRRMAGKFMVEELMPQKPVIPAPKYTLKDIALIAQMGRR